MFKPLIAALAIILSLTNIIQAEIDNAFDSACFVSTIPTGENKTRDMGSCVCFRENKETLFFLTSAHVVGKEKIVGIKHYISNTESDYVYGVVIYTKLQYDITIVPKTLGVVEIEVVDDIAIIAVSKTEFRRKDGTLGQMPAIIPLAEENPKVGDLIYNCGCSAGGWPSCVRMTVLFSANNYFGLTGNQARGRSGSAILNNDCTKILGLVTLTNGYCISAKKLSLRVNEFFTQPEKPIDITIKSKK